MTTATMPRVARDRKAEALADSTLSLAGRFGDQVPTEKIAHALRVIGWRAGADAVNRANDPACGLPYGWQNATRLAALEAIETTLGRFPNFDELVAFDSGYHGALAQGA